jgi:RpiR family transcriptional regulator, carbohydrate utilization regulator
MRNRETAMLERIRSRMSELRRSEQRVAATVLADPDTAITRSIAEMARLSEVSEPTVMRFCRALGYAGFQDFKLALARDLGGRLRYASQEIVPEDDANALIGRVVDVTRAGLERLRTQLDPLSLEHAIERLAHARRVEFCGSGGAGIVSADAQLKFARLGISAVAYADAYIHNVTASLLGPDDVLVAISHSGRSRDLLLSVDLARQNKAVVIALCPGSSPLAERADIVLAIETGPGHDVFTPIRARVGHLLVIDMLAIGVALRLGSTVRERLNRASTVLSDRFMSVS